MTRALLHIGLSLAYLGSSFTAQRLDAALKALGVPHEERSRLWPEMKLLEELMAVRTAIGAAPLREIDLPSVKIPALAPDLCSQEGHFPEREAPGLSSQATAPTAPCPDRDGMPQPAIDAQAGDVVGSALYVYAVVPNGLAWTPIPGVDGQSVFLIEEGEVAVLVHHCRDGLVGSEARTEPDLNRMALQAGAHDQVIVTAMALAGTVIPLRFPTVVRDRNHHPPEDAVRRWLRQERARLLERLEDLRNLAEYAIAVYWEQSAVEADIRVRDPEIVRRQAELASKSPNLARLYQRNLDRSVQDAVFARAQIEARAIVDAVTQYCADTKEEREPPLREGDEDAIVRLAVLLDEPAVANVGEILDRIGQRPGFRVRFTGPWPPYSFANLKDGATDVEG